MVEKYVREESMIRGPKFLTRLRSHTVFMNAPVKILCSVEGFPMPIVKWYKDGTLLDTSSGKYLVEGCGGLHSLEIPRCTTDDTAQYIATATNQHGQASTQASIIVKRFREEEESCSYAWLPFTAPMPTTVQFTKIFITFVDKFAPVFAFEGDSTSLTATMTLEPNLANLQPEAQWYRDGTLLSESKWVKIHVGRGTTTLSIPTLAKEDEGLYTLRMVTRGGVAEHSAFVSVADTPPPVPLAPPAPMDLKVHDANRDYVIVSWKPPNTTTEGPIVGYFVDKCEVGTENWTQCNDHPIKICKYAVTGLFEGHSFYFRVRAVNAKGISKPSRISDAIAALDPTEFARLHAIKLGGKLDVVSYHDQLEAEGKPPGPSTGIVTSEIDRTYVVLKWKGPHYCGKAPMWYYIEKLQVKGGSWTRVNTQVPIRSPRYAVFDLQEGTEYQFRVLSANMYGTSEASAPSATVTTLQIKGVPSAPGQVVATRETDTSVLIQWAPPKEPNQLIGYYIDTCLKGAKDCWTAANHKPRADNKFVVSGLTTGETYVFRVQAINEIGLSDESQESSPLSVKAALTSPSAPYDIGLLNCDGHSMVLNWKKPLHDGGAPIKEYYVDKRRAGTKVWREVNIPPVLERVYKVEGLTAGAVYQFHVYAANLAGLGKASKHSADLTCDAWNMPEPGPGYDLRFSEVRDDSLVMEWEKPVYSGAGPITGYKVEYAKTGSSDWTTANEAAVSHRFLKVTGLEVGTSYVFRVRGVNEAGVGAASLPSDAVVAKSLPGTQEVTCGVDEKTGDIVMSFESCQMGVGSQFVWKKNYKEITDFSRSCIKTEGSVSKLVFTSAEKDDFGTFSVSVTNTAGVSSSHVITAEALEKMLALSYDIRHPIIPLKTELSYKILERGRMRFWLQAEEISSHVTYKFFGNNKELSGADPNKMAHDVNTGVIEYIMDHFTEESEGTFTCQITDGGGKGQSSLVLIGDDFKAALAEADFQRREYIRVKEGPHFSEFLTAHVGEDCSVALVCKVANLKKESEFHWFKEDTEIIPDVKPDLGSGVCKLPISLFSAASAGVYRATIHDDRGKDMSQIDLSGKVFDEVLNKLNKYAGATAAELVIKCTATGIQLQCHMKYFTSEMNVTWMHGTTKLAHSEKTLVGGSPAMATMEVIEPMDKDKGMYSITIADAENTNTRTLDLSGEVYEKAFAEFMKLKAEAYAEKNRGKVVGGLPDVVTIMEKKTLSLTCTVCGDPKPQVSWMKNGADVTPDDQYVVSLDQGRFASLTIKGVSMDDSGKYTMTVQNKYGGECVDIVVSVYKSGEKLPDVKPTVSSKTIIPPKLPIEMPQTKPVASPSPAPAASPSPTPPKAAAGRGVKSPTPTKRK